MSDEYVFRTLHDLTEQEWTEITLLARKFYDQGLFNRNQLKCACEALVVWLSMNENIKLEYENESLFTVH